MKNFSRVHIPVYRRPVNMLLAWHHKQCEVLPGNEFTAGYMILITKNEEKSFWLLDALVGRILANYYSPEMLGQRWTRRPWGSW